MPISLDPAPVPGHIFLYEATCLAPGLYEGKPPGGGPA